MMTEFTSRVLVYENYEMLSLSPTHVIYMYYCSALCMGHLIKPLNLGSLVILL